MLIFKSQCTKAIYAVEQLHYLLGIEFIDDVQLVTDIKDYNKDNFRPTILFSSEILKTDNYDDDLIIINTNIIDKIFDYFSLDSEKNMPTDILNRVIFPEHSRDKLKKPIIDISIYELRGLICSRLSDLNVKYNLISWNDKPIVCLTHDVDSLKSKSWLRILFWILSSFYKGGLKEKILESFDLINSDFDEYGAFEKFIELEKRFSFKSTYFFLSLPFFLGSEGRRYRIKKNSIKKSIYNLIREGFEIGLHTSRKGSSNTLILKNEIRRLREATNNQSAYLGVRNHYLAGSFQDIWSGYENLGFLYDSTLGWHDYNGYRSGTSIPYTPYDLQKDKAYNIYELPQIIMDGSIEDRSSEEIFEDVKFFIDQTKKHNSVLTISWHTNRIISREFKNYSDAYRLILHYLKELNFISLTASEIIHRTRNYQERVKKNLFIQKDSLI